MFTSRQPQSFSRQAGISLTGLIFVLVAQRTPDSLGMPFHAVDQEDEGDQE